MTRRGPFIALLSACVISVAGTSMSAIAVPWLVLSTTGSAAKTGLVAFAQMGAYVLTQMLAGPVIDRVGLRRSFVVGNLIAAVAVGAVPLVNAVGGLTLPVLIGLVTVAGAVRGAADGANVALVPATAEIGGLAMERAAGLNGTANNTARLLGAPLAGILVAAAGPPTAIAVDAVSFAVAALMVWVWVRIPSPRHQTAAEDREASGSALRRYGRDLAEGLRFVRGDRLLLGIITMVAVTNLLDQGFQEVMTPVWVRREIGSASALGVLGGVGAVASIAGTVIATWVGRHVPRRTIYSVGFLLSGAPRYVVLAVATTLAPVVGVFLVTEMFAGSLNPAIGATAYERIPDHLRARVLGLVRASAWAGIPFGALIAGYCVEGLGLRVTVLAFAGAYLVTTLAPFVFPAWRGMKRPDPVADAVSEGVADGASEETVSEEPSDGAPGPRPAAV